LLNCVDGSDKDICKIFYPDMFKKTTQSGKKFEEVKALFKSEKKVHNSAYDCYNKMEKVVLGIE
jgi:hypothetical protein